MIPWAGRRWELPFLTILAPSKRWSSERGRRHKMVVDRARQAVLQTRRWLLDRRLIVVADAGFSGVGLIAAWQARRKCRAFARDNAFIEAFNGRFRAECLNAHWFPTRAPAREKREAWRTYCNEVRPHGAIGNKVPISLHNPDGAPGPPS